MTAVRALAVVGLLVLISIGFAWIVDFLRDADANRLVIASVAIGVGVGGVFGLFWAMNRVVNWCVRASHVR